MYVSTNDKRDISTNDNRIFIKKASVKILIVEINLR